ncbi:YpsA SLOG family protein [Thiolapillus brandeum]|uniref:YpsA SLOG family protein n=1 Tax=Thiolapillus brandeum TaxID=1076588 RepID=UPI0009E202BE
MFRRALNCGRLTGGTAYTQRVARQLGRPCLVVSLDDCPDPEWVRDWLAKQVIRVLNVLGPRESKCLGIYDQSRDFLRVMRTMA